MTLFLGFSALLGCGLPPKPYYANNKKHRPVESTGRQRNSNFSGETVPHSEKPQLDERREGESTNRWSAWVEGTPRPSRYALQADRLQYRLLLSIGAFLDARYQAGGSDPTGVDCSGFVKTVFEEARQIKLPHNAAQMYRCGKAVNETDLMMADLVFFRRAYGSGSAINHVGIYLWDRRFVHATTSSGVIISILDEDYWRQRYAGARRLEDITEQ
jgi:hypothetical protein